MTLAVNRRSFRQATTALALLMVFLTLFLSCNLRKAVQFSLELPVTKSLNQSKAIGAGSQNCLLQYAVSDNVAGERRAPSLAFYTVLILAFVLLQTGVQLLRVYGADRYPPISIIPLFILYRKILI